MSADVTHAPAAPTGARPGAIALPRVPFCVIRHGETDFNRDGRVAGRSDAMLTVAGRCAASRLATLDWPGAIRLYCSPQTRARDTAALAFPDLTPVVLSDLRRSLAAFHQVPSFLLNSTRNSLCWHLRI